MDIEACRAVIDQCYPGFIHDREAVTAIEDGWDSLVLDIEDTFIFRFPRRPETLAGYAREAALLPALSRVLSTQVPKFEFSCLQDPNPEHCFVGYRKIHGLQLSAGLTNSSQIAFELANFLTTLHRFPVDEAEKLTLSKADALIWQKTYLDFFVWIQEHVFPMLKAPIRDQATAIWEGFLNLEANFRFQPVLMHGDLCGDHVLCEEQREGLSGVIDWGDARLGDPAGDFAGLFFIGGPNLLKQVLKAYQGTVDATFLSRVAFYLAAIPFHQIRFGLQVGDQCHLEEGLHSLPVFFSQALSLINQESEIKNLKFVS
jgi:aminoglycoside 2''-phosphotransferase